MKVKVRIMVRVRVWVRVRVRVRMLFPSVRSGDRKIWESNSG